MKEHPDYKYRPRRKPKAMPSKKSDPGANAGHSVPYPVRGLLPHLDLPPTTTTGTIQHHLNSAAATAAAALDKFPRSYLSPYHRLDIEQYPEPYFYHIANDRSMPRDLSVAVSAAGAVRETLDKSPHEMAMDALYRPLYSPAMSLTTLWQPMMKITPATVTSAMVSGSGGGVVDGRRPTTDGSILYYQPSMLPVSLHHLAMSRPMHGSSASSSTSSPPTPLSVPQPPMSVSTSAAVIKRPIALPVNPARVVTAGTFRPEQF